MGGGAGITGSQLDAGNVRRDFGFAEASRRATALARVRLRRSFRMIAFIDQETATNRGRPRIVERVFSTEAITHIAMLRVYGVLTCCSPGGP